MVWIQLHAWMEIQITQRKGFSLLSVNHWQLFTIPVLSNPWQAWQGIFMWTPTPAATGTWQWCSRAQMLIACFECEIPHSMSDPRMSHSSDYSSVTVVFLFWSAMPAEMMPGPPICTKHGCCFRELAANVCVQKLFLCFHLPFYPIQTTVALTTCSLIHRD